MSAPDTSAHNRYETLLSGAGIRITAVRLLVLKTISERMHGDAFSLQDVMQEMVTADNSSVFRTLTLFAERRILRTVNDGSGMQKYCLAAHADHVHDHDTGHVHFTCTVCQRTVCLTDIPIPHVSLPDGYEAADTEFIVKGICPRCRK